MPMSWREAIEKVLREADRPLHYAEISEQVLSRGYYKTDGATPDATVNAQITTSIKHEGEKSPFAKVGRGTYTLRAPLEGVTLGQAKSSIIPDAATSVVAISKIGATTSVIVDPEADDSLIRCLGMYWQRDLVVWRNEPRIFGKQQAQSKPVDFSKQRAIYILYDHHTVVYVGRSVDRPLGKRLFEHTTDRLGSRWNRFSWFGLLDVTNEGKLVDVPVNTTLPLLIGTLEALLIEVLEPPQNRKRGDDFSVFEYIQDIDPELKERQLKDTLRAIEQKLREQD
jgi:hypothetical protein